MSKISRSQHRRLKQPFWFDLGRLLFPDLINHPRTMNARMIAIALTLVALLLGATIGFFHRASNPADLMRVQARELDR